MFPLLYENDLSFIEQKAAQEEPGRNRYILMDNLIVYQRREIPND